MQIRPFEETDTETVVALWKACDLTRPWNDPYQDIARKRTVQPDLFLVGLTGKELVGTVMAGYDGHRGWINYLAVSPEHQGNGWGRQLMDEAETRLRALGCPKINLQVRSTNEAVRAFYEAIGFGLDKVVSFGKRLESDA